MTPNISLAPLNFEQDVLTASHTTPIVVDFWAPWCGPCRVLGPAIEALAKAADGQWQLVKVNTDQHPGLSTQYGIRGIPAVKMFHRGEVVAEFVGALPKHQIAQWLEEHLPGARKDEWADLLAQLDHLDPETAQATLRTFVTAHPDIREARLALAQTTVFTAPAEALTLVADVQMGDPEYDLADAIRTVHGLHMMDFETEESPAAQHLAVTQQALHEGDAETAIQRVIDAVIVDKYFADDLPRRTAIALFRLWGPQADLTKKYRRNFEMALY